MQETLQTQVQSLGGEDPLVEEIATHSSILARKIPRSEEPAGLQAMALQRVRHDLVTTLACMQHGTERDNVFKFYF